MVKFIAKNKVRMHDTDMAQRLYFTRQYRFANDALEDLMELEGMNYDRTFREERFAFVIVHSEADYFANLHVGDVIVVETEVEYIRSTSFAFFYKLLRNGICVGTVQTVHVTINLDTHQKIPIPDKLRSTLEKYLMVRQ